MAIGEAACVSVAWRQPARHQQLARSHRLRTGGRLRAAELIKPGTRAREVNGHAQEAALSRFDRPAIATADKTGEIRPLMQEAMQFGLRRVPS